MERTLSPTKVVVCSVLPIILLLVVSEITLRVWAYYFRTSYERYNYSTARLELVPNIHVTAGDGREIRINSKGFVGREFEAKKPSGVYRIFALGDSCTFGGSWNEPYPAVLQLHLNSLGSRLQFEVINAGVEGYNSEYALARLKTDVFQYDPDMVIIYIGWNDLMKVNPDGLSDAGRYPRLARIMGESFLMRGYSKLIFYYLRPLVIKPRLGGDEQEKHAFDNFIPVSFQENLKAMLELLQDRNIRAILLTLPTIVKPGMSNDDLRRQAVFFPYYAGVYSLDKFLSLHRAYNMVIRNTALKYDIPLVDLDSIFNTYEKDILFWDTMHPSVKGHNVIARTLFDKVKEVVNRASPSL